MTGPGAEAEAGTVAPSAPAAVPGWESASWSTRPLGAPVLSVDGVEGPLDWLVEMARARKLDLSKLSILALVEAFGAAMTAALDRQAQGRPTPVSLVGESSLEVGCEYSPLRCGSGAWPG